jgi:hypothetical protein
MSKVLFSSARSRWVRATARMWGSSAAIRRAVNVLETKPQMRVCSGGSIARKDACVRAYGPRTEDSSMMPLALEKRRKSRNAVKTSSPRVFFVVPEDRCVVP